MKALVLVLALSLGSAAFAEITCKRIPAGKRAGFRVYRVQATDHESGDKATTSLRYTRLGSLGVLTTCRTLALGGNSFVSLAKFLTGN